MPHDNDSPPFVIFPSPPADGSYQHLLALASEAEGAGSDGHALQLCVKATAAATDTFGASSAAASECEAFTEALADRHVARMELSEAHRLRGNAAFGKQDFAAAEACYDEALSLTPKDAAALTNRAACLLKRSAWEAALADAELAIRVDPKRVKATYRGSQALLALERPLGARLMLDAALGRHPTGPERKSLEQLGVQVDAALASGAAQASATAADAWSTPPALSDADADAEEEAKSAEGRAVANGGRDDAAAAAASRRGARGVRGAVRRAANVAAESPAIAAIAARALSDAHEASFRAHGHTSIDLAACVPRAHIPTLFPSQTALIA